MVKTIGFTKENDEEIVLSAFLNKAEKESAGSLTESEQKKLLDYIGNADHVFAISLALYDGKNFIGPYMIFSDGEWVWPSHFPYYLIKYNFHGLDIEFINHIRKNEYKAPRLKKEQKEDIESFLYKKLLRI